MAIIKKPIVIIHWKAKMTEKVFSRVNDNFLPFFSERYDLYSPHQYYCFRKVKSLYIVGLGSDFAK